MISLKRVPSGFTEIVDAYGLPGERVDSRATDIFVDRYITGIVLPFDMIKSCYGIPTRFLHAHTDVILSLADALQAIIDAISNVDPLYPKFLEYGGCYEYRLIANTNILSTHAWGIGVDICPSIGRRGNFADRDSYPPGVVYEFKSRGWEWGGEWENPDPMHFQACTDY